MNATGIIRRVDDLGRIVLPKEVRRKVGISEGTPMEIFISDEGIMLKKYYLEGELESIAKSLMEAVEDMCVDLGPEKTGDLRRHIREILMLLKPQN
jgi:stage V sporulation protein T